MSNFENYFNENFAKVLKLVETTDKELVKRLISFIDKLPQSMKRNIKNEDSCMHDSLESTIKLHVSEDYLNLESTRFKKYLKTSIYMYPFYEDELFFESDDDEFDKSMLICSFTQRNTENNVLAKFYYDEIDGKYFFKGANIPKDEKEEDFVVYLDKFKDFYVLTSIYTFDGIEMYKNERLFTYEELQEFTIEDLEEDAELDESNYEDTLPEDSINL